MLALLAMSVDKAPRQRKTTTSASFTGKERTRLPLMLNVFFAWIFGICMDGMKLSRVRGRRMGSLDSPPAVAHHHRSAQAQTHATTHKHGSTHHHLPPALGMPQVWTPLARLSAWASGVGWSCRCDH